MRFVGNALKTVNTRPSFTVIQRKGKNYSFFCILIILILSCLDSTQEDERF